MYLILLLSLIKTITGQPVSPDEVCCECVPFFQCVNGTINTDGSSIIQVRLGGSNTTPPPTVNVRICPNPLDVCCLVPDANPACSESIATPTEAPEFFAPPSDSDCECVGYADCDPSLVVSDGLGTTGIQLSNGRVVNHSTCQHSLDVCCYLPDLASLFNFTDLFEPTTLAPLRAEDECQCVPSFACGADGHAITDGHGLIDIRLGPSSKRPKPCPSNPNLVCCLPPPHELGPSTPTTSVSIHSSPTTDEACECVIAILCGPDGRIISSGKGAFFPRLGVSRAPVPCPTDPSLVCCLPPATELGPSTPSTSVSIPSSPRTDEACACVIPVLCGPDGRIITSGKGAFFPRLGASRTPVPCPTDQNLVCCLPPGPELLPINEPPPVDLIPVHGVEPTECECVEPYLCGPDGYIIIDGVGVIDVRLGQSKQPQRCPYNPSLVCCLPPKTSIPPTTPVAEKPCGQRNNNGIGVRILGFRQGEAQFGEFPWVAAILKKAVANGKEFDVFVGGGALIHPRVVMTAIHKIQGIPLGKIFVRLGEYDTASTKEALPHQEVKLEQIIVHPGYSSGTLTHDIALLILEEEAHTGFHISKICPAKSLDDIIPEACIINGWGEDALGSGNYQKIMKSVQLPLVRRPECQALLRKTRLSSHFKLHKSFVCAGGEEGIDACEGDGGGPLSCPTREDPTRYLQVGITAWGIGCGVKNVPGVYVDVAHHNDWIMNHLKAIFPDTTTPNSQAQRSNLSNEERRKRRQQRKQQRQAARREEGRRNSNRQNRRGN